MTVDVQYAKVNSSGFVFALQKKRKEDSCVEMAA